VRVAVDYVDKVQYGIWLTVSSIVAWMAFFDIGLSNGMRNKFAEAISQGDEKTAKIYVSTTYFSLLCIFLSLWIIFISVHQSLDWCTLLNLPETSSADIHILILIVFSYFCIQFVLRTIMTVLTANQEPAKASLIDVLGQLFSLLIIFVLIKTTQGSLIYLGLGLTIAPLIVLIVANLWFFNGRYKEYAPALSSFKLSYFKNIWGLSFKFFIIQVAALVQYQTANIIIARSFSMESVTDYNIVYKYFNVLLMGFTILITPFWSAATEAYAKNDFAWIKNAVKRYNHVLFFFITGGAVMWLLSGFIYDIWMGKGVISIPFQMSLWCLIYVLTSLYGSIYVNLLNGIGSVKIQYYSSLITPFLFIALCWIFINRLHWGVYSLFIASIISNLNGIVLAPIQYKKIFIEGKGGIWKA
jgi:O-antigen/teichoic acid export membrane protein